MPLDLNALTQMTPEQLEKVSDLLDQLHDDLEKEGNTHPDTLCGLEFVCQALGIPGYEFS